MEKLFLKSKEETAELAQKIATEIRGGDSVLLFGDLGAGKTTFTKALVAAMGSTQIVKSPTFVYVRKYKTNDFEIQHYDLYRIESTHDLSSIGWDDFDEKTVRVVEWAERLGDDLPSPRFEIRLRMSDNGREAIIQKYE